VGKERPRLQLRPREQGAKGVPELLAGIQMAGKGEGLRGVKGSNPNASRPSEDVWGGGVESTK